MESCRLSWRSLTVTFVLDFAPFSSSSTRSVADFVFRSISTDAWLLWVSFLLSLDLSAPPVLTSHFHCLARSNRHIHLSLRTPEGKNAFAWTGDAEGRPGALYKDTKHISQLAEWFLAGLLDGLQDGSYFQHRSSLSFEFEFPFDELTPLFLPPSFPLNSHAHALPNHQFLQATRRRRGVLGS